MAVANVKAILDTSIYLSFLRKGGDIRDLGFLARPTLLYLSSVVFAELNAGARDRGTVQQLNRFYATFDRANRVAAPDKQTWFEAAQVLQQFGVRYGFDEKGISRLSHDVLIALTARKIGATVFTRNRKDFERIAEIRAFDLRGYDEAR